MFFAKVNIEQLYCQFLSCRTSKHGLFSFLPCRSTVANPCLNVQLKRNDKHEITYLILKKTLQIQIKRE
jgi:hypothetical protein